MEGVWGTSVSGLGVRLTSTTTTPNTGTTTMVASGGAEGVTGCQGRDTSNPCRYGPDQPATANGYPITISMKVELVKIAPTINTGQSLTGYVFGLSALNIADSTSNAASAHTFSGTSFVTSTCTRTSPDPLVVKLPPLTAAQLSPPGTTGGDTPFSLDFTCATARNVRMTMTDVQNLGTADDKLALSPDSASATGVKLQVLFKGTPIIFNPNSQATGIAVGSSTGGGASFTIPLTVHYISTGTVTPGTVNASAIYTLSYQ
jgi:type 1 fimbria pilin